MKLGDRSVRKGRPEQKGIIYSDLTLQFYVLVAAALRRNRPPVQGHRQACLMPAPVIGDRKAVPTAMRELRQMRRSDFYVPSAISDEPQNRYPSRDFQAPAPVFVLWVAMRRDDISLFSLGEQEADANR